MLEDLELHAWKLNLYKIVELEGLEERKVLILVVKLHNAWWAKNTRSHVQTPVEVNKHCLPICLSLGAQSYPIPVLVEGSKYPVELVEVYASWPGHHCHPEKKVTKCFILG